MPSNTRNNGFSEIQWDRIKPAEGSHYANLCLIFLMYKLPTSKCLGLFRRCSHRDLMKSFGSFSHASLDKSVFKCHIGRKRNIFLHHKSYRQSDYPISDWFHHIYQTIVHSRHVIIYQVLWDRHCYNDHQLYEKSQMYKATCHLVTK